MDFEVGRDVGFDGGSSLERRLFCERGGERTCD